MTISILGRRKKQQTGKGNSMNKQANNHEARVGMENGNPFKKHVVYMDEGCWAVYQNGRLLSTHATKHEANQA